MKYLLIFALLIACAVALRAAPQAGTDARAREIIKELHLTVLPKESGYLGIIGVSPQKVNVDGRDLAVQSHGRQRVRPHRHAIALRTLQSARCVELGLFDLAQSCIDNT